MSDKHVIFTLKLVYVSSTKKISQLKLTNSPN